MRDPDMGGMIEVHRPSSDDNWVGDFQTKWRPHNTRQARMNRREEKIMTVITEQT